MPSQPPRADTPERQHARRTLRLIAARLTTIHRALIGEATASWAIATGAPPPGPLELFRLLREDQAFAWLQPITRAILETEDLAAGDFEPAAALAAVEKMSALLDAGDPDLMASYRALLQRDVEFAGAHAELRAAVKQIRTSLA